MGTYIDFMFELKPIQLIHEATLLFMTLFILI